MSNPVTDKLNFLTETVIGKSAKYLARKVLIPMLGGIFALSALVILLSAAFMPIYALLILIDFLFFKTQFKELLESMVSIPISVLCAIIGFSFLEISGFFVEGLNRMKREV